MIHPLLIPIAVFVAVSALVAAVAMLFRDPSESRMEDRLSTMLGSNHPKAGGKKEATPTLLAQPMDAKQDIIEQFIQRFSRFRLFFEQADTTITPSQLVLISGGLAAAAGVVVFVVRANIGLAAVAAVLAALLPLGWLVVKRNQRLKKFSTQLPDALELISRALRAGHSLASGFNLVHEEMADPIGKEFGRVFEEQNLGIPMEEALQSITDRVPNLDLKFFATAVILQRQTGGDLAEILDKIGSLVRERFKIWGQIQALTGEGRLSGVVLLGLPPCLFLAVYRLNREYVMMLFTDPMGKKMLAAAIVMQVLGALVIRKIVNIKV